MEDLTPPVQTDEQSKAGLEVEAMLIDLILESLGARQPTEESSAPAGGLGRDEWLAPTVDGSAVVPGATAVAAESSEVTARVADATSESAADKPVAPEEQTALPEASEGVVGHAVRPPSPLVVPLAAEEEDKVEDIKHEES